MMLIFRSCTGTCALDLMCAGSCAIGSTAAKRLLRVAQVLAEEVHSQVVPDVEAHLQDPHLEVVRGQQDEVGQDLTGRSAHRRFLYIACNSVYALSNKMK